MNPISARAFQLLTNDAVAIGANPHDWALLIYSESTWSPAAKNAAGYYGLNQIGINELRAVGWVGGVDAWLAQSIEGQLPYVTRFFRSKVTGVPGAISAASAGHMYAANFLPGRVKAKADPSDVDYPLCVRGETSSNGKKTNFYEQNAVFDADGKGTITIRDMSNTLRRRMVQNPNDTRTLLAGVNAALATLGINSPDRRGPTLLDPSPNTITIGEVEITAGEGDPTAPGSGNAGKIIAGALIVAAGVAAALWKRA
jgi:hypothetical protein